MSSKIVNQSFSTSFKQNYFFNNLNNNTYKIDQSAALVLERYFSLVDKKVNIIEVMELFEEVYEDNLENKDLIFLYFWYPFITSQENIANEILMKTVIFCGDLELRESDVIKISSYELNNNAFNIAYKNNLNDIILSTILKQGKIHIPIEFIYQKFVDKNIDMIESAWQAKNKCFFATYDLSKKYLDYFNEIIQDDIINKRLILDNKNFNKLNNMNDSINNNSYSIIKKMKAKNSDINNNNSIQFLVEEEFLQLFVRNSGNLTLTKLIMIAEIFRDNTPNNEKDENATDNINSSRDKYTNKNKDSINNLSLNKTKSFEGKSLFKNPIEYENLIRAICLFDKEKHYSSQILLGLYICMNIEIPLELLQSNLLSITPDCFKISLFFKDMRFSLFFYSFYSDFKIFAEEELHMQLLYYFSEDVDNIELYLFFIKQIQSYFNINTTKILLKQIEDLLQINSSNNKLIQNIANPIKIFVLLAEILKIVKNKYSILDFNIQRLIDKCLEYSKKLQQLIEEDNVFREIILERDVLNRTVLEIISQNDFLVLLENKLLEKIVNDIWSGPYEVEGSLLEVSSQYRSLMIRPSTKDYDIYTKQRAVKFQNFEKENIRANSSNFYIWRHNIFSKYYSEVSITLIIALLIQLITIFMIDKYKAIVDTNQVNFNNMIYSIDYAHKIKIFSDYYPTMNFNEFLGNISNDFYGNNLNINSNKSNYDINSEVMLIAQYFDLINYNKSGVFLQDIYYDKISMWDSYSNNSALNVNNFNTTINYNNKRKFYSENFFNQLLIKIFGAGNDNYTNLKNYLNSNINIENSDYSPNENLNIIFNIDLNSLLKINAILNNVNNKISNVTIDKTFLDANFNSTMLFKFYLYKKDYSDFIENIKFINKWKPILDFSYSIFHCFVSDYLLRIIFSLKAKMPNLGLTIFPDTILFLLSGVYYLFLNDHQIDKNFMNIQNNFSEAKLESYSFFENLKNDFYYVYFNDPYFIYFCYNAFICAFLWLKFFLIIQATKTFGPIIVIFSISIKGVLNYILLFLGINASIAFFGYLIFYNVSSYSFSNIFYSFFYYLILSLSGDSKYEIYLESTIVLTKPYLPYIAAILIIIIILINTVIFINLIIALLTNIYETYRTYSIQLFIQKKLEIKRKYFSEDIRFNSLLINIYPLNTLILPLAFLFLFLRTEKSQIRLNKILLYINYSFFALFYFLYYSLATIFLIPIAYFKILFSKFLQIFVEEVQQYFPVFKIISFLLYLVFGILLQLKAYFRDIGLFIKELFRSNLPLITENENFRKFTLRREIVNFLIKIFKNNSQNVKRISLEKLLNIILYCLEIDSQDKEIIINLGDYDLDNPEIFKDYEQQLGNFNLYNNQYVEEFRKKGIVYEDVIDFFSNFYDDQLIFEINTLKSVLIISKLTIKRNKFYKLITDKNYNPNTFKKQKIFLGQVNKFLDKDFYAKKFFKSKNNNVAATPVKANFNKLLNFLKDKEQDKNVSNLKTVNNDVALNVQNNVTNNTNKNYFIEDNNVNTDIYNEKNTPNKEVSIEGKNMNNINNNDEKTNYNYNTINIFNNEKDDNNLNNQNFLKLIFSKSSNLSIIPPANQILNGPETEENDNLSTTRGLLETNNKNDNINTNNASIIHDTARNNINKSVKKIYTQPFKAKSDNNIKTDLTIIAEKEDELDKNDENNKNNKNLKPSVSKRENLPLIVLKKANILKLKCFQSLFKKNSGLNINQATNTSDSNKNKINSEENKDNYNNNNDANNIYNVNLKESSNNFNEKKSETFYKKNNLSFTNPNNNVSILRDRMIKEKIFLNKNSSEKEDFYKIPVISRTSISILINDLKEYQTDLSKKISENLIKNQKYLSDITKANTNIQKTIKNGIIDSNKSLYKYPNKQGFNGKETENLLNKINERLQNLETSLNVMFKNKNDDKIKDSEDSFSNLSLSRSSNSKKFNNSRPSKKSETKKFPSSKASPNVMSLFSKNIIVGSNQMSNNEIDENSRIKKMNEIKLDVNTPKLPGKPKGLLSKLLAKRKQASEERKKNNEEMSFDFSNKNKENNIQYKNKKDQNIEIEQETQKEDITDILEREENKLYTINIMDMDMDYKIFKQNIDKDENASFKKPESSIDENIEFNELNYTNDKLEINIPKENKKNNEVNNSTSSVESIFENILDENRSKK